MYELREGLNCERPIKTVEIAEDHYYGGGFRGFHITTKEEGRDFFIDAYQLARLLESSSILEGERYKDQKLMRVAALRINGQYVGIYPWEKVQNYYERSK